jgi:hypothetical protein
LHIRPLFIPLLPFFLQVTLRYEWAEGRDVHIKRKQDIEVWGENELRGEKQKKIRARTKEGGRVNRGKREGRGNRGGAGSKGDVKP